MRSKRMYFTHSVPHQGIALTHPDRTKRVKDARNEAQKEIDDYRKEKEDEYQNFEKEVRSYPHNHEEAMETNGCAAQFRQPEG